uniref:Uncharacterized protein n=1 Tax=viral metagenome TaxID=1070528 RepID=A0A6C0J522_9ZZZZ
MKTGYQLYIFDQLDKYKGKDKKKANVLNTETPNTVMLAPHSSRYISGKDLFSINIKRNVSPEKNKKYMYLAIIGSWNRMNDREKNNGNIELLFQA